jgi:hypothetical protein
MVPTPNEGIAFCPQPDRERPCRRPAKRNNEFSSPKGDFHVTTRGGHANAGANDITPGSRGLRLLTDDSRLRSALPGPDVPDQYRRDEFPFIRRIGFSVFVFELLAVADAIYLTFQT